MIASLSLPQQNRADFYLPPAGTFRFISHFHKAHRQGNFNLNPWQHSLYLYPENRQYDPLCCAQAHWFHSFQMFPSPEICDV